MLRTLVLGSAIVVSAAVSVSAGPVEAAHRGSWRAELADKPLGKMIMARIGRALVLRSELDVTSDQRDQIRGIVKSNKTEIAAAIKPIVESRRALRDAVLSESANESDIRAAADKLGKDIGDAAVRLAPVVEKVRSVMSDEQLDKIREFKDANRTGVDQWLKEISE